MIEILHLYVKILCSIHATFQQLPGQATLVLSFLGGGYAVPTSLALAALVYWFKGVTAADRVANQRAVLRGLVAALIAWGVAALNGLAWRWGLSDPELARTCASWPCWHGPPSSSAAAAVGFALGTMLWRRDWRWGLGVFLATGLWTGAQICCGHYYPMDVVVGAMTGASLAWLLGSARWLDRPLDALIRLARRLMLA